MAPLATEPAQQRNSNPRKLYPADPGLIRAFAVNGRTNTGHAFATVVPLELERREMEVGYMKTDDGFETDFLARHPSGEEALIQVCANPTAADTRNRELRVLTASGHKYQRSVTVPSSRHLAAVGDGGPCPPDKHCRRF